jgi:UDP-N-acetylglucosamine--dolichyl-phosphate N-acetylglucosaminephosphotransferase
LRLLNVRVDEKGRVTETSNLTIINLWLVWRGPLREDRLATEILVMQMAVGLVGLWARHSLALLLFSADNRF